MLVALIDEEAREAFPGLFTHLRILPLPGRTVALLEDQVTREVLAIAAGTDHARACVKLLGHLQSRQYNLSASETAEVLGTSARAVRQRVQRGTLVPASRGLGPGGNSFAPAEVGRVLALRG